ncbi:hypothetical protein BGX27_006194, partial [Mortierella sp. AM989]
MGPMALPPVSLQRFQKRLFPVVTPIDLMAMKLDNIQAQLNAIMRAVNNNQFWPKFCSQTHYQGNQGHFQPLSNRLRQLRYAEKQHLMATGGCFRCRGPDHHANNCSKGSVSFNIMLIYEGKPDDNVSGKASCNQ